MLVLVSLLGGPRLGAPLIPLPGEGGAEATRPIAGPLPSHLPGKNFPQIPPEVPNPPVPPVVLPTVAPSTTGRATDDRSTTGQSVSNPSTTGRWTERSVADSRVPGSTDRGVEPQGPGSSTTNPAEHPDPSIPPATKTPPPPPPTTDPPPPPDTPGNPPDKPDQPSLTDALFGLLDKIL